jgi:Protein of unknown function (DUF3096)
VAEGTAASISPPPTFISAVPYIELAPFLTSKSAVLRFQWFCDWPRVFIERSSGELVDRQRDGQSKKGGFVTINLATGPVIALVAGILILIAPRLLNYIVAIYLIIIGAIGIFGWSGTHIHATTDRSPMATPVIITAATPPSLLVGTHPGVAANTGGDAS